MKDIFLIIILINSLQKLTYLPTYAFIKKNKTWVRKLWDICCLIDTDFFVFNLMSFFFFFLTGKGEFNLRIQSVFEDTTIYYAAKLN